MKVLQDAMDREAWGQFRHAMSLVLPSYYPQDPAGHLHPLAGKCVRSALIFRLQAFWPHSDAPLLAAAIECLHTASLFHDDVLDHSLWRRGAPSAQCVWGTKQAILMGDWWLTRALMLLNRCHSTDINTRIHQGLHMMVTGQCHEVRAQDPAWPLWRYVVMMARKTALLFALAAQCAAALGKASASAQQALYRAGLAMGIAYQLDDDGREYQQPVDTWGIGHDWLQGKMTFPCRVVYDMWPKTQWQAFWQLQAYLAQVMSKQQESCSMGPWRNPLEEQEAEMINGVMQEKHKGRGRDKEKEQDMSMDMDMGNGQGKDHIPGQTPQVESQQASLITLGDVLTPSWRSCLMEMLEALEPGLNQTAWLRQRYVDKGLMAWQNATHTPACSLVRSLFFGHFG